MKIEVGKTYVDGRGRRVRIVSTNRRTPNTFDGPGVAFPVLGLVDYGNYEDIGVFTLEGRYSLTPSDDDLVREANPYDRIRRGDLVRYTANNTPKLAHFYGLSVADKPIVYADSTSPWTAGPNPTVLCVEHVELVEALNLNLE